MIEAKVDFRKLNAPPKGQAHTWKTAELTNSFAWRAMSGAAMKVVARIEYEHSMHHGRRNGELPVTYGNFEEYGLSSASIAPALAEAAALGFIERTNRGHKAWGSFKGTSARYRITWLPTFEGAPPKYGWRKFKSLDEARDTAKAARDEIAGPKYDRRTRDNSSTSLIPAIRKQAAK